MMKFFGPFSIAALGALTATNSKAEKGCETYPPEATVYGSCDLAEAGEEPLWRGLPEGIEEVSRYAFIDGRGFFWVSVTVTQNTNGTANLRVVGTKRRTTIQTRPRKRREVSRELTPQEVATLRKLAEDTGTFDFEIGSWDEADAIYLHCQTLQMERANSNGYRFSSASISCNRPAKLVPLVEEIARLAGLELDGAIYH
ncbi:hypothetical protein [Qipengyuania gelatinilytica]|uniref:Uncharacterized protein n=1 Tax=Qipengyuania gelatinilytica TaxID=2867231 RepID=A0ABX8ZYN0_9SPHN|nr:hypothetical protein [Qipengyuania gelatinilytica]QZD94103.1 hypothetical protein K3136_08255 [Qipengyuania gelatinilytica]